jgi:hypothetical protein
MEEQTEQMPSCIKIHVGQFAEDGTENCDFRNPDGTERLGAEQGDHHKTIWEKDPASQEDVDWVLANGPILNRNARLLEEAIERLGLVPSGAAEILANLGLGTQLRIGVWPGDGRD